jgi:exonuclease III
MKTLAWNCRGLSRPSAIRSLRNKVRNHSPDDIFLSETKTSPSIASNILHSLGFYSIVHVPPIGSKGGLLLAWRSRVELECFVTIKFTITAWCYSDPPQTIPGFYLVFMAPLQ